MGLLEQVRQEVSNALEESHLEAALHNAHAFQSQRVSFLPLHPDSQEVYLNLHGLRNLGLILRRIERGIRSDYPHNGRLDPILNDSMPACWVESPRSTLTGARTQLYVSTAAPDPDLKGDIENAVVVRAWDPPRFTFVSFSDPFNAIERIEESRLGPSGLTKGNLVYYHPEPIDLPPSSAMRGLEVGVSKGRIWGSDRYFVIMLKAGDQPWKDVAVLGATGSWTRGRITSCASIQPGWKFGRSGSAFASIRSRPPRFSK